MWNEWNDKNLTIRLVLCAPIALFGVWIFVYDLCVTYCQRVRGTARNQSHGFEPLVVLCILIGIFFPSFTRWLVLIAVLDAANLFLVTRPFRVLRADERH